MPAFHQSKGERRRWRRVATRRHSFKEEGCWRGNEWVKRLQKSTRGNSKRKSVCFNCLTPRHFLDTIEEQRNQDSSQTISVIVTHIGQTQSRMSCQRKAEKMFNWILNRQFRTTLLMILNTFSIRLQLRWKQTILIHCHSRYLKVFWWRIATTHHRPS